MLKQSGLKTFYSEKMIFENIDPNSPYTPDKPKRIIDYLDQNDLLSYFDIVDDFAPFDKHEFYIAHHKEWVNDFFAGEGKLQRRNILGIEWSPELVESERYTSSSLYHAIRNSIQNPDEVCFSPTSGFHHAIPKTGALFCAFSGQVIASCKIHKEFGLSGCYIDLDGHWGNSIDNSYKYVPELVNAIPPEIGNINIDSEHGQYLLDLGDKLKLLREYMLDGRINYVVFCHGADSHEWDYLGGGLSTEEWIECSRMVYNFIQDMQQETRKQIPLSLCLFGGYRNDDYNSVLSLHTADLVECLNILCGQKINYTPMIKTRSGK